MAEPAPATGARRAVAPPRSVLPLECAGVTLARAGRTLLHDVALRIETGGVTALMGPNGAGKSLLLRVLANLVPPDRGTVRWAGRAPDRARASRIGFVFQKPVMLRRSVIGNVTFALAAAGVARRARRARALDALALAGLESLARAPARVLSGGEQQRLAIARALAAGPEVLLLDEPTSSLDPASTLAVEQLVGAARARGAEVVFVTHDLGQGHRLADEVVFLHAGRLTERTPAPRFFQRPESEAGRAFVEGRLLV